MAFLCNLVEGEARNIECQNSKWITPEQLKDYDFAAADIPIVDHLVKHINTDL